MLKKSESIYELTPLIVTVVKGSMITAKFQNSDRVVTRNSSCFKKMPVETPESYVADSPHGEEEEDGWSDAAEENNPDVGEERQPIVPEEMENNNVGILLDHQPTPEPDHQLRRSSRTTRGVMPERFQAGSN